MINSKKVKACYNCLVRNLPSVVYMGVVCRFRKMFDFAKCASKKHLQFEHGLLSVSRYTMIQCGKTEWSTNSITTCQGNHFNVMIAGAFLQNQDEITILGYKSFDFCSKKHRMSTDIDFTESWLSKILELTFQSVEQIFACVPHASVRDEKDVENHMVFVELSFKTIVHSALFQILDNEGVALRGNQLSSAG